MTINLLSVLRENNSILGSNYSKIGKITGSGFWCRRKILLSFDKSKGWTIIKLNPFQLFFRNVFGTYKSTHLKNIFKHLIKEKFQDEVESKFYHRITEIWTKKFISAVGNAAIDDANIFCLGESHGDISYRAAAVQFINDHYQQGDIVLVEGVRAGETINAKNHQMIRGLKEECVVQGWEPENFEELHEVSFSDHKAKYKNILDLLEHFNKEVPTGRQLTSQEFDLLEKKINELLDQVSQLNKYYQSKSPRILNAPKFFTKMLEMVKNKEFQDPGPALLYVVATVLEELENCQEKALYKNMNHKQAKLVLENGPIRDKSLIIEISKYSEIRKRVFVVGGLAHFLQLPRYKSNLPVRELLQKHRFVVMSRNSSLQKIRFLNPGLTTQKFFFKQKG